jgi:hypothetical protein
MNSTQTNNSNSNNTNSTEFLFIAQSAEIEKLKNTNKNLEEQLRQSQSKIDLLLRAIRDIMPDNQEIEEINEDSSKVNVSNGVSSIVNISNTNSETKNRLKEMFQSPAPKRWKTVSVKKVDEDDCMFSKSVQPFPFDTEFYIPVPFPNDILDIPKKTNFATQIELNATKSNREACSRDFCGNA